MLGKQKGFTLIELLVVISIIGVLSTIAMTSLNGARAKARDAKRKLEIGQIQEALELYYADHNRYPVSGGAVSPNGGWNNSNDSSWNNLQSQLAPYLAQLSKDPINTPTGSPSGTGAYSYTYFSLGYGCDRQWYMIVFRLETGGMKSPGAKRCSGGSFNYTGYTGNITVGECKGC